jgi:hypothetical protein
MPHDETPKTLTFVVPAYNMQEYLGRCVSSLLATANPDDIEVLIIDDGSCDDTPALADRLAEQNPGIVRAIHQKNKGHGGAVNAGVAEARGMYLKVIDADDWVGAGTLTIMMQALRQQREYKQPIDLFVTDYVYDKVNKRRKHTVHFRNVMKAEQRLGWNDLKRFGIAQYMIMHALTFRTDILRQARTELPEHTFYVDFIYAYQPFPWVNSIMYLPIPFYHYYIGRSGQSVETDVMIRRVNQLVRINGLMAEATPERGTVSDGLYRYMIHFLSIESVVASAFLILSRDPANYEVKRQMWNNIAKISPQIARDVRRQLPSRAINLPGRCGRFLIRHGYRVANAIIGFN